MTREEKIEAIYKEMANKKRAFGCRCRINNGEDVIFIRQNKTWSYLSIRENEEFTVSLWYTPEIIWHPIMIGDVIYYIRKKYWNNHSWFHSDRSKLIDLRSKEREPIEWQYDGCIDYVYGLIPSKSIE